MLRGHLGSQLEYNRKDMNDSPAVLLYTQKRVDDYSGGGGGGGEDGLQDSFRKRIFPKEKIFIADALS